MGEVFLAWDERLRRPVAIKRVRADLTASEAQRRRLRREARAGAQLDHSAIVRVFDIIEEAEGDSVVMEYVEGRTLAECLARGEIDVATALRLGRQIAEGLAEAHAHGLLHRDLKTQNIMVNAEGRAKILDFGLTKRLPSRGEETQLTQSGALVGTPATMSPEQAEGKALGPASDLYSLGVVLYQMVTGVAPLRAGSPLQLYRKLLDEAPPPPRSLRPELPEELSALIVRCLHKRPEQRPASAAEVARALHRSEQLPGIEQLGPPAVPDERAVDSLATTAASGLAAHRRASTASRLGDWLSASRVVLQGPGAWLLGLAAVAALAAVTLLPQIRSGPSATTPPASAHELYRQGVEALARADREGAIDEAIEIFERAIERAPRYAPAHSGLGRALWHQYRYKRDPGWLDPALSSARTAVELAPQLAHAQVTLAFVLGARGETGRAREILLDLLALDPANADVHRGLADLEALAGRPEEAIAHYRTAVRLAPERWDLHAELGVLLQKSGAYGEAREHFERGLELAPDNAFLHLSLGGIHHFEGRYAEAARSLQQSIEIRPSAHAYSNLGTLYFFRGNYREAARAFEHAVELVPNHHLFWANLGDAYRFLPGHEQQAADAFRRSIQLIDERSAGRAPTPEVSSRRALYGAKAGECAAIDRDLARLGALETHDAHTVYRAALALELCGERSRALAALERALESGYSFAEVQKEPDLLALREDLGYHRLALRFSPSAAAP